MDYLGWELERQRSALAALLLGSGNTRDGGPVRNGTRQSDAGTPEPDAGSGPQALAWEAARAVRQDREGGRARTVETPVSVWEAVLGGEAVWTARRGRETGEAGTAEAPAGAWEMILDGQTDVPINSEEGAWLRLSGGTGVQPKFPRPSAGYVAQWGVRRTGAGPAVDTRDLSSGIRGNGAKDGAVPSETESGRAGAAVDKADAGRFGRFRSVRRSGGSAAGRLDRDKSVVSTAPWGGGRGAAALRAEESARLLSRAVQRDARRYDGGFNIY